jgi:hypothetical protein
LGEEKHVLWGVNHINDERVKILEMFRDNIQIKEGAISSSRTFVSLRDESNQ